MIQTKKTDLTDNLFPFSDIKKLSDILKTEALRPFSESDDVMELPVNNYLKTPQEIEMEFQYGINPRKNGLQQKKNILGSTNITTDGYLNIHDLDKALSGFMEENY